MRIQYWGTAAAEGFPAMFCACDACRRALELGGKNIRTRASALVDESVMLDFSPDTNYNRLRYHYDMRQLRAVCITHAHIDHLSAAELGLHAPNPYCRGTEKGTKLQVFCSEDARKRILESSEFDGTDAKLIFSIWTPYKREQVSETLWITPLPAKHDPQLTCYIFLIQSSDKSFLYAHDTAFPDEEIFEFLKGKHLDGISLDCNYGMKPSGKTHMGFEDVRRFTARLEDMGCLQRGKGPRIINHFSHSCDMSHEELERAVQPYGFEVSWDGKIIDI